MLLCVVCRCQERKSFVMTESKNTGVENVTLMTCKKKFTTQNIFLICKEGVEWNVPVEAYETAELANTRRDELQKSLDEKKNKDVYDSLSAYAVTQIPLKLLKEVKP